MAALRAGRRFVLLGLPAWASVAASLVRSPYQGLASWTGPGAQDAAAAALFVHFDPAGAVAPRVLAYLDALRATGVAVFLVSNSGNPALAADPALRARCAAILVRRNVGYDFGALREGLAHWQFPQPATRMLLLVNDSVLTFAPLAPALARIDFAAADLWGAVDSPQRGYHLQSWFLAAGRTALEHPGWRRFWDGVRPARSREWAVGHYEVALTRTLQRRGLRVRALWPYPLLLERLAAEPAAGFESVEQVRQLARARRYLRRGHALNPTADLWRQLAAAGCPFVKRELLGGNPAAVADVADCRLMVARALAQP